MDKLSNFTNTTKLSVTHGQNSLFYQYKPLRSPIFGRRLSVAHRQREADLCPVETDTLVPYSGWPRGLCRLIGVSRHCYFTKLAQRLMMKLRWWRVQPIRRVALSPADR